MANATVASVALCSGAVGDTTLRNVTLRFDGFRAVSEGVSWMTVDCASLENVSIALVGGSANVSGAVGSTASLIYFTSSNQMVANVDISVHTTDVSLVSASPQVIAWSATGAGSAMVSLSVRITSSTVVLKSPSWLTMCLRGVGHVVCMVCSAFVVSLYPSGMANVAVVLDHVSVNASIWSGGVLLPDHSDFGLVDFANGKIFHRFQRHGSSGVVDVRVGHSEC